MQTNPYKYSVLISPRPPIPSIVLGMTWNIVDLEQWFSMCSLQTSNMGMPWELVKSAHIQVHPRPTESETLEVRSNNMHFNKSPNARSSLRTSSPENN